MCKPSWCYGMTCCRNIRKEYVWVSSGPDPTGLGVKWTFTRLTQAVNIVGQNKCKQVSPDSSPAYVTPPPPGETRVCPALLLCGWGNYDCGMRCGWHSLGSKYSASNLSPPRSKSDARENGKLTEREKVWRCREWAGSTFHHQAQPLCSNITESFFSSGPNSVFQLLCQAC